MTQTFEIETVLMVEFLGQRFVTASKLAMEEWLENVADVHNGHGQKARYKVGQRHGGVTFPMKGARWVSLTIK